MANIATCRSIHANVKLAGSGHLLDSDMQFTLVPFRLSKIKPKKTV